MVDGLTTAIIIGALAVAAFSGLMAVVNRPPNLAQLAGLALVEVGLIVQAVVAVGRMFGSDRPASLATFIGYLLSVVLLPPLAALLGWTERTRWGSAIVSAACLVVPVLLVRLQQIWHG